jgi:branched-chain amino acid transport system ATP-binding protein
MSTPPIAPNIVLNVNGIEVIYNHVILVLKGVSLQVPEGGIVALLGGNGAGKTTTLRAVSNLLALRISRLLISSSGVWCR